VQKHFLFDLAILYVNMYFLDCISLCMPEFVGISGVLFVIFFSNSTEKITSCIPFVTVNMKNVLQNKTKMVV
jgi:hypothetical protein